MSNIEAGIGYTTNAVTAIRNSYGFTAVVAFGLATEISSLSDKLATGSALCLSATCIFEGVRSLLDKSQSKD